MVFGKPAVPNLSPGELAPVNGLGVAMTEGLRLVSKAKIGTVTFAAGVRRRDSTVCLECGGRVRFGNVVSLLSDEKDHCFATISLRPTSETETLASRLVGPPTALKECFQQGLYGRQFLRCLPQGREEIIAVNVMQLKSHCLFINTCNRNDVYVTRLHRHFVHD